MRGGADWKLFELMTSALQLLLNLGLQNTQVFPTREAPTPHLRTMPASPINPVPNRRTLEGSGTGGAHRTDQARISEVGEIASRWI